MRAYVLRRLLLMIPTLLLVSLIVFFGMRLVPGSVVDIMVNIAQGLAAQGHAPTRADIAKQLGLDVPVHIQYFIWIGNILIHGDFGKSMWTGLPVIRDILIRMPLTIELSILSLLVAMFISLPIGVISALRQDSWGDYIARSFAILCIAVPGFWLGTMIIVFPSIWWGYMPRIVVVSFIEDPLANLKMFIVPAIVLGMGMAGGIMRMIRSVMLEVLKQDYIRTAWAKGLMERAVIMRHALKNAMIPIVTIVAIYVPGLFGGAVIIEQIFSIPGIGRMIVHSTLTRDYPMLSAIMLIMAVILVFLNLFVDLTYAYLDPRVGFEKRGGT
jgi:peptide/nickel transport system permease protein